MAKVNSKKNIVKKKNNIPTTLQDQLIADSGLGTTDFGSADLALPYISILQANSPQCVRSSPGYIEGAQEGMFYNTVGGDTYDGDEGILIVPCGYQKKFVEWVPRDSGGGWVGAYSLNDPYALAVVKADLRDERGKLITINDNHFVDTGYHFYLYFDGDKWQQGLSGLTSTQLKQSRRWNSNIVDAYESINGDRIKLPMFGQQYKATTAVETKDTNSWMGWRFSFVGAVTDSEVYTSAKAFYHIVDSGNANIGPPPSETNGNTTASVI